MIEPMRRVHTAGIPVVGYLNRIDTGKTLTFVGVDDYQLGCEVTRYLVRHLKARGSIVLMQGPAGSLTSVDRMRGFHDTLKIACVAVEAAVRHLRGETIPPEIILPVEIVDRGNYAAWDRRLEERECPRWEHVT